MTGLQEQKVAMQVELATQWPLELELPDASLHGVTFAIIVRMALRLRQQAISREVLQRCYRFTNPVDGYLE
jgi:hypothetical protein